MFGDFMVLGVCTVLIVAHWLTVRQFGAQMHEIRIKLAALEIQLAAMRSEVSRPESIEGDMIMQYQGQRLAVRVFIRPTRWR